MAEESKLIAETRTESGSTNARRLRREGGLPGVVNLADGKSVMIKLNAHIFEQMLHHHTSENIIIDTIIDGKKPRKMLVKDVQHDPVSGNLVHVDLFEVSMTETMKVKVPLELIGDPVGVTMRGGVLEHLIREIEVECLPDDLVEIIEVDVSALDINDSIQVSDLKIDSKLTIITAVDVAVAAVAAPRKEEEAVESEEGAEPEVVSDAKKAASGDSEAA